MSHSDDYDEKYTDPELRRQIKQELLDSDKGGESGQWSARKSQFLVREYEKRGGGYKQDHKDEAARSLSEWTEQDWQTEEGDTRARHDGITERYLPKAVWDQLSEAEKQEAEQTKEKASQQGEQHVEWTPAIKKAMHEVEQFAQEQPDLTHLTKQELYAQAKALNIAGRSKMSAKELVSAIAKIKQN